PMLMKNAAREDSMGHLGRIQDLKQLPSNRKLLALVKEAMKLNEDGIKLPKKVKIAKEAPETPDVLLKELKKNSSAMKTFQAFSSSCKKEYIEWITEAKTDATRERRTHQAVEWMAEGKKRNWKYEKC
ncbi:MAG TPA: YdeI/OmpD-associated family protein, partial [Chitinophagaceae bacterium]|nr:YdeI/OmpD-associated family protein [Chitinophagaceae bacterium]